MLCTAPPPAIRAAGGARRSTAGALLRFGACVSRRRPRGDMRSCAALGVSGPAGARPGTAPPMGRAEQELGRDGGRFLGDSEDRLGRGCRSPARSRRPGGAAHPRGAGRGGGGTGRAARSSCVADAFPSDFQKPPLYPLLRRIRCVRSAGLGLLRLPTSLCAQVYFLPVVINPHRRFIQLLHEGLLFEGTS